MTNKKTKNIAITALMIALVFVGTFSIRFPNPATGGYFHMGDSMMFTGVIILGKRNGSIAGALGGALLGLTMQTLIGFIIFIFLLKSLQITKLFNIQN